MNPRLELYLWAIIHGGLIYGAIYIFRLDTDYISKGFMMLFLAAVGLVAGLLIISISSQKTSKENISKEGREELRKVVSKLDVDSQSD